MTIWSIIKAEYLVNENATKNWLFVVVLVFMGIVIINMSHDADAKVKEIVSLKKEVKGLRSEFVELKAQVMKKKMATDVYVKLKDDGYFFPKVPPVKIVVDKH